MSKKITTLIDQFTHREVRDLAWVIVSPPLVSGVIDDVHWWSSDDCLSEFNDCLDELTKLDIAPTPLINHLSNVKNKRLGSVFEAFISYWLVISPNYRELTQNIQIIEDKHTYGEIDFIIEEISTQKIIHLEVAVKFYLGCVPYEDAFRWFGTNTKDQLGKKVDHLRTKQTQLSKKYPEQLKKYFKHDIDQRHCFIKGRLFYPENSDISPQQTQLAKDHLRGRWYYLNERDESRNVIKINKSHWLTSLNSEDIKNMELASVESIESIDRAECFVMIEDIETELIESQRVFYLPKKFIFPEKHSP